MRNDLLTETDYFVAVQGPTVSIYRKAGPMKHALPALSGGVMRGPVDRSVSMINAIFSTLYVLANTNI